MATVTGQRRYLPCFRLGHQHRAGAAVAMEPAPQLHTGMDKDELLPEKSAPLDLVNKSTTHKVETDAPPCPECSSMMVRNGACYKCLNCGATSGCS